MCVNDWRLGRWITHTIQTGNLTTATLQTNPHPQRVGIILSVTSNTTSQASLAQIKIDGSEIMALTTGLRAVTYTLQTHGRLVQRKFEITIGQLVNCNAAIIEFFMPENVMQVAIEEFERSIGLMR